MRNKLKNVNTISILITLIVLLIGGNFAVQAQTTAQVSFINSERASLRASLPVTEGDYEFTDVKTLCAVGCDSVWNDIFLEITARTPSHTLSTKPPSVVLGELHSQMLGDYCSGDFPKNNIPIFINVFDSLSAFNAQVVVRPNECPSAVSPTPVPTPIATPVPLPLSPNSSFLNSWASDIRAKLPLTAGDFDLLTTESNCPNGCENADRSEFLVIFAKTPRLSLGSVTLAQLETQLKPAMTTEYCGSGGNSRNLPMTIFLRDMNDSNYGNFWINSIDCRTIASTTPTPQSTPSGLSLDDQFWDAVKGSTVAKDFQSYLDNFPSGSHSALARLKISQLTPVVTATPQPTPAVTTVPGSVGSSVEDQFWQAVENSKVEADLQSYLTSFPSGKYVALARLKISRLNSVAKPIPTPISSGSSVEDQYWDAVKDSKRAEDFENYLKAYPSGTYVPIARLRAKQFAVPVVNPTPIPTVITPGGTSTVEQQYWDAVKTSTKKEDFEQYLRDYPNGQYVPIAKLKVSQLSTGTTPGVNAEEIYWNTIASSPQTHSYRGYLINYPSGKYAVIARLKVSQGLGGTVPSTPASPSVEDNYWNAVKDSKRPQDFQSYLSTYPTGKYAALARLKFTQTGGVTPTTTGNPLVEDNYWNAVKDSKRSQDFQSYLNTYPTGKYAAIARLRITQLGSTTPNAPTTPIVRGTQNLLNDILRKAQFGSVSELRGKRSFWVIAEGNDFDSKKIITDEITDSKNGLANSFVALREEDADFIVLFRLTNEKTGAFISSSSSVNDQTHVGEMIAYTLKRDTSGRETFRVLFRTTKKQFFSTTGITWNRHPAVNAARQLVKDAQ